LLQLNQLDGFIRSQILGTAQKNGISWGAKVPNPLFRLTSRVYVKDQAGVQQNLSREDIRLDFEVFHVTPRLVEPPAAYLGHVQQLQIISGTITLKGVSETSGVRWYPITDSTANVAIDRCRRRHGKARLAAQVYMRVPK
jgi:hypothetical protein